MGDILAFAEQRGGRLRAVANEAVSTAAALADRLGGVADALVLGGTGIAEVASSLGAHGAARVLVAEHAALERYTGERAAKVVAETISTRGYSTVLFPATALGKDLSARVAALLDVPLATEATALRVEDGCLVIVRPVYAGKAYARVRLSAEPALVSLRPTVFPAAERPAAGKLERVTPDLDDAAFGSRLVELKAASSERPDVAEAPIVVSGGRGMKDPSNWPLLEMLRDALGAQAALGASRAVVDAGWRPHAEQVGQTGKTVSPKLYFAVGISGAIQHLAGMRTSRVIVAINKDRDAPIFKVADYGIVGDLFEVVPRLAEEIRSLRSSE
ncbi:MAG: electron transfer flavoprotein subunit alpha/FixB family protein [Gemmatimonadetes bacterium]|nr:electron transfer flavoprotein subunit alpha/FixB family protein [Gemmatimonadota bacterium]